jgi:ABC-type sugar transport system permease subunit
LTTSALTRARRAPRRLRLARPGWPQAFLLPALAAIGLCFLFPLVVVIRDSFYGGSVADLVPVGLNNYRFVFEDPVFWQSLLNNLKLFATVPITTTFALLIALVINDRIRGWRQYRAVVFFPFILPSTVIGLTFSFVLALNGTLNTILHDIGLGFLAHDWLGTSQWAIPSIGGVVIWQQLGFGVVVFSAALLALPPEVTEAARIDGASWGQIQRRILIPQIRGIIEFFMVLQAITVLSQVFNYVYVLTNGGPGTASSVLELYIWKNGFALGAIGTAATVSVMLLALATVLIAIYMRLRARQADA